MVKIVVRYAKLDRGYVRVRLSDGRIMHEHRFLMEKKLGRKLKRAEHVHHKDENRSNNAYRNLEKLNPVKHGLKHAIERPAQTVSLVCPACRHRFTRTRRYVRSKKSLGQKRFMCGRSCRMPKKLPA